MVKLTVIRLWFVVPVQGCRCPLVKENVLFAGLRVVAQTKHDIGPRNSGQKNCSCDKEEKFGCLIHG